MQTNILQYLEETVKKFPNKVAFADEDFSLSFTELFDQSRSIGSYLISQDCYKEPVVVFMNRHPKAIAAFLGVAYSGCFYVPVDEEMPSFRIELIIKKLKPKALICDPASLDLLEKYKYEGLVLLYDDIVNTPINQAALDKIRSKAIDTDPLYIVYTSGSTGIPKGIVGSHRAVIDYIESLSPVLSYNSETVFGSQSPLYFDACLREIIGTIKHGSTTYLIPKSYFMFPIKLVDFLNEYKVNTICWVVPALTMISSLGVLEKKKPEYLHTIAFVSEIFPIKQFNIWRKALPEAKFVNLYGPTETTGICTYYIVDRDFGLDDVIPIGGPLKNTDIFLLDENDQEPPLGELGEICIRGTCLTHGYYNDFERTQEAFVQNPLNTVYPELIYRTGDLAKYNEYGELVFVSRKDFQIKHMGHRIELGEIEINATGIDGVHQACCVYDKDKSKIVLYYVGSISEREVAGQLKKALPRYMVPNSIRSLETMPLTANGKINRSYLKEITEKKRRENDGNIA